jgi:hypothetical protein
VQQPESRAGTLVCLKASNGRDGSRKPYHPFVINTDNFKFEGRISCLIGMYSEMGVLLMREALGGEDKRAEH